MTVGKWESCPSNAPMIATIRAHIANVEAELRANREKSLDVAVDRWMAAHRSA